MPRQHPSFLELSKIFFEMSYLYEMAGVAFKPRAYQLAAESVAGLKDDVETTWRKGGTKALMDLPAIGQSTAEKIDEFFRTGHIKSYEAQKKNFPVDIWGLSRIEGLGPRHIADLYRYLKVKNLNDLKRAIAAHKPRSIPRWGAKSEERLAKGLHLLEQQSKRLLLGVVLPKAEEIIRILSDVPGIKRCVFAGSLRRRQETIGDIDLIATTNSPQKVMDAFVSLPMVVAVHEKGKTRSSVRLNIGIDADLRVVPDKVFGATLQYFTGDKRHNVLLREYALSKGYTLNEYGLFKRSQRGKVVKEKPVVCRTEEEIYTKLGMDTPPPEIRVGDEEIEAARQHRVPKLLPYGSVRGDLQVQTDWTDGYTSLEEMVNAARREGRSYIAITDHTKALAFVHGLDEKKLAEQGRAIDELQRRVKDMTILKGTECDILKDGSLDLNDEALKKLDWVGVSVHSHFKLSREEQTKRIMHALANPHVDCMFHPSARLIDKRDPIEFDFDEILAAAKKYRVAMEINSYPDRLDLCDSHIRAAVRAGVMLVINTDAHAPEHFKYLHLGEAMARRGWAEKKHVLNTKSIMELRAYLRKKNARRGKTE